MPIHTDDPQAEGVAPGDEATNAPRLRDQHKWPAAVLREHYAYFRIPGNSTCLGRFRHQVIKAWRRVLLRRSQRPKLSWERFKAILKVSRIPSGRVRDWRHHVA